MFAYLLHPRILYTNNAAEVYILIDKSLLTVKLVRQYYPPKMLLRRLGSFRGLL